MVARMIGRIAWGWRAVIAGALGIAIGVAAAVTITTGLTYVLPAHNDLTTVDQLRPIIDRDWIKVPFDIIRDHECLAQSTITLRRWHDYPAPIGRREDVVTLGLFNTTITGLGETPVMLWFARPHGLESGEWNYVSKTEDDCGGWLSLATRRPRTTRIEHLMLPEGGA